MSNYPDWVAQNPDKWLPRLQEEGKQLYRDFPNLGLYIKNQQLYIEGPVVSMSQNAYLIRVLYHAEYPFYAPAAFVVDEDVIKEALKSDAHLMHNYGVRPNWGLQLCFQNSDEWKPKDSGISVVQYAIAWVNAFEYCKSTGRWPLKQ